MPPSRVGLLIQTPALGAPTGWSGLITDVVNYTVRRQNNQGGSFSIAVRASAQQASQIRTGWQISLKEERLAQNGSITMPEWIMRFGRVLSRSFTTDPAGGGILTLQGETWLGRFINYLIHTNQSFAGANLETILAGLATATGTGIANSVPIRTVSEPLTISLNDQTLLANLIKLAELTRTNLRETWDANVWEYTDQDDVPAMGGVLELGPGDLYLRQVERGDPSQAPNNGFGPGQYGVGIIQGVPTVAYDGKDVVNRVVGIGTEYDGSELTLEGAVYPDGLYSVISGTGPDGKPYWYIEDTDSQAAHGLIEFHYVRTDVKNPSNTPTTKAAAKAALLAVTMNELLRRRSEIASLSVQVLNGGEIAALPGSRAHIRYKGVARLTDGSATWLDVDQFMLISARTDSSSAGGIRLVVLDLVAPLMTYRIPVVPDAVPIPTPLPRDSLPSFMPDDPIPFPVPPAGVDTSNTLPPLPDLSGNLDAYTPILDTLKNLTEGNGAYQPCCADPTTDVNAGVVGPIKGTIPPSPAVYVPVGGVADLVADETRLFIAYESVSSAGALPLSAAADCIVTELQDVAFVGGGSGGGIIKAAIYIVKVTGPAPELADSLGNVTTGTIEVSCGGGVSIVAAGATITDSASDIKQGFGPPPPVLSTLSTVTPATLQMGVVGVVPDDFGFSETFTGDLTQIGTNTAFLIHARGYSDAVGTSVGVDYTGTDTDGFPTSMILSAVVAMTGV